MSSFVPSRQPLFIRASVAQGKIIATPPSEMSLLSDRPERFHERAIVLDGPLLIPHRLSVLERQPEREENLFELSRVLVLAGETAQSASLLDNLLSSARGENEALYLAGHRSNLDFIDTPEDELRSADGPCAASDRHRDLLKNFGRLADLQREKRDLNQIQRLFTSKDPFSLLHLNLFSLIGSAERRDRKNAVRALLLQQLQLINIMKQFCPEIAWDRYSPLIAQSLRLQMLDVAYEAWREARSYAFRSGGGDASSARLHRYVQLQKMNLSIEWKIHEYLGACILIAKGRPYTAIRRLTELKNHLALFPEPYLKVAVDCVMESLRRSFGRKSHSFSWPDKIDVRSHATYLVAWPAR